MQSTQRNRTNGKFSFRSVRLKFTVGRFPQNCSYPVRPKVDFQAERFKLLAIGSVPFRRKRRLAFLANVELRPMTALLFVEAVSVFITAVFRPPPIAARFDTVFVSSSGGDMITYEFQLNRKPYWDFWAVWVFDHWEFDRRGHFTRKIIPNIEFMISIQYKAQFVFHDTPTATTAVANHTASRKTDVKYDWLHVTCSEIPLVTAAVTLAVPYLTWQNFVANPFRSLRQFLDIPCKGGVEFIVVAYSEPSFSTASARSGAVTLRRWTSQLSSFNGATSD
uniref:Uncharacterized protein n=1 Tax=Romanomermis culicivorax TaxID=13658 RepID=A0A915HL57_ROMCU